MNLEATTMVLTINNCRSNPRLVGDPVDVVTGALVDVRIDLRQKGPIPLEWTRYYSSARNQFRGSLGWGFAHEFDRALFKDLDGIRYQDPTGAETEFPDLAVGDCAIAEGMKLRYASPQVYEIFREYGPVVEFHFDPGASIGRLSRIRLGKDSLNFHYELGSGRLKTILDSRRRQIEVIWNEFGLIQALDWLDPTNGKCKRRFLEYTYSSQGNLLSLEDLYATKQFFQYDSDNRLICRTDRNGYSFNFSYDQSGRCIKSCGEDGLFEVSLDYRQEAKTTIVRRFDGGQWMYFYNDAGTVVQITDPYGNATRYLTDDSGRTIKEIDPNGNETSIHYNSLGEHDYRVDPNGNVRPTLDQDPDPPAPFDYHLPETPLEWEFGHVVDPSLIRPLKSNDDLLREFSGPVFNEFLGFRNSSKVNVKTAASVNEIDSREFDDFDRMVARSNDDFTEQWKYDSNGNLVEHIERSGAVSRFIYGSWNALQREIDPAGNTTTYEYNPQGLITKVVDPGGTTTDYAYDLCDRLVEVRRNGQLRETYARDRAGNIISKRNSSGQLLVEWEIGPGNVPKLRSLDSGEQHIFQYDDRGRLVSAKSPVGDMTISYDDNGNTVGDQRDGMGVSHHFEGDELTSTSYFDKFIVNYQVQRNGDLLISDPLGGEHRIQSRQNGLIAKTFANGNRELSQFDQQGRCIRKGVAKRGDTEAWIRRYRYTPTGDLITTDDSSRGVTHYSYDLAHRLLAETLPNGIARQFRYDSANNLLEQPGLSDVSIALGNQLENANDRRFVYNDRGHIAEVIGARSTTRFKYNEIDLLVAAEIDGVDWSATYDPYCRRVSKTWQGKTTTYYWDDFRLAAEVGHDGSLRVYVYVTEKALIPFLFVDYPCIDALPETGRLYYIFTNQIGAPIRVEDSNGTDVWNAQIDPYGYAHVSPQSSCELNLRFAGHYFDDETELHFNRFRYFAPVWGRYIQSDPAGIEGGINLNSYPVVPTIDTDIDGLKRGGSGGRLGRSAESSRRGGTPRGCPPSHGRPGEGAQGTPGGDKSKRTKAQRLAEKEAKKLRKGNPTELPTSVSVVVDTRTGKTYTATSGKPVLDSADAHPNLGMPAASKAPWPQGNCAEPKAINQALNDGANKEDLQVATVRTGNGKPQPCCPNCKVTTQGTSVGTG